MAGKETILPIYLFIYLFKANVLVIFIYLGFIFYLFFVVGF